MIIRNSSFIHINNIITRGLCTFKVLFINEETTKFTFA